MYRFTSLQYIGSEKCKGPFGFGNAEYSISWKSSFGRLSGNNAL